MKTLTPLFSSALPPSVPPPLPPSTPPAEPTPLRAGPPWRVLLVLAALVLLVHMLALRTAPRDFGPTGTRAAAPTQVAAMLTRSIAVTPPAPTPTPPQPTAAAAATPAKPTAQAETQPAPPETPAARQTPAAAAPAEPAAPAGEAAPTATNPAPNDTPADPPAPAAPDSRSASTDTAPNTSTSASTVASTSPAPEASAARSGQAAAAAGSAASAPAAPPAAPSQTPVTAMALPGSAQMGYEVTGSVKGLSYNARGELLWRQRSDSSYDVSMTVSAMFLGSRGMTSQGQVGPQGLVPTRFSDKSRTEVAAHFEADKGQISFSANTPSMPWLQGGQDRASVFIQLGGMLAGSPERFPAGSTISVYTVGPRDAEIWTFRIEGQETLNLPFGQLAAIKVSRQLRHERDQQLEVWYAPSLGYLPVRNKISQSNGDFVDQQLSSVSRP